MNKKHIVALWQHIYPVLLYPSPSGVVFTNQAGGILCKQPEIEGIMLPVPCQHNNNNFRSLIQALRDLHPGCNGVPISPREADVLDDIFFECSIPLVVKRDQLRESMEAWLWVCFRQKDERWMRPKREREIAEYIALVRECGSKEADEKRIREFFDGQRVGETAMYRDFAGEAVILTWENCD